MPRLGGGNVSQSYLIGLSDGSSSTTTAVEMASASGDTLSPHHHHHQQQQQQQQQQTISHRPISPSVTARAKMIPRAPSSVKSSASSSILLTPRSPRARAESDHFLPTMDDSHNNNNLIGVGGINSATSSSNTPRKVSRTILRAAESGKGSLLPNFSELDSVSPNSAINKQFTTPSQPAQHHHHYHHQLSSSSIQQHHHHNHRDPPDRNRCKSTPSLKQIMDLPTNVVGGGSSTRSNKNDILPSTIQDTNPKLSIMQAAKQSIRRRPTSGYSDDEDAFYNNSRRSNSHGNMSSSTESPYRTSSNSSPSSRRSSSGGRRFSSNRIQKLLRMKLGHFLQILIVLSVTVLVWESHHKALFASEQLNQFKEEESLLVLHLQQIERQLIQLHENMARMATSGQEQQPNALGTNSNDNGMGGHDNNGRSRDNNGAGETVDYELIHKQTQQLYQMEEELNHEVRTLQARIQHSSRNHIIQEFGEGPVQVVLDLDFGAVAAAQQQQHNNNGQPQSNALLGGSNRIAILLWHDTPHAAWTLLEQVGRHVWDGAEFKWQQAHTIDTTPKKLDPLGGNLEFVEQSQHGHEAWTVGLREADNGGLSMYINLQDNDRYHKHETCVGKVIDGFDALQRLLEISRAAATENKPNAPTITIKSASAMHVTKREGFV